VRRNQDSEGGEGGPGHTIPRHGRCAVRHRYHKLALVMRGTRTKVTFPISYTRMGITEGSRIWLLTLKAQLQSTFIKHVLHARHLVDITALVLPTTPPPEVSIARNKLCFYVLIFLVAFLETAVTT
jgi:hypothetical protein